MTRNYTTLTHLIAIMIRTSTRQHSNNQHFSDEEIYNTGLRESVNVPKDPLGKLSLIYLKINICIERLNRGSAFQASEIIMKNMQEAIELGHLSTFLC